MRRGKAFGNILSSPHLLAVAVAAVAAALQSA